MPLEKNHLTIKAGRIDLPLMNASPTQNTTGTGNFSAAHKASMTANQMHILRGISSREEAKTQRDELVQKLRVECAGVGYYPRWAVEEVAALNLYVMHA